MHQPLARTALLSLALLGATAAQAATGSTTMVVTATVATSCAVAALPLAFGTLGLTGGNNDSQTTITLTCTPGTAYTVGLDGGAHAAGGVRQLAGTLNGSTVPYYIYTNAARTAEWGNTAGTNTVAGTAIGVATSLTVYGRIPGNAALFTAGGYSDVVNVTVTF